jgi:predicted ArsR family transcriptional regulator
MMAFLTKITAPPSARLREMSSVCPSDANLLDLLRKQDSMTVAQFEEALGVTATAVRQRLNRLLALGYVERDAEGTRGRGRPSYRYRLTMAGRRNAGVNFADLAIALWQELRSLKDRDVQRGLLQRIAQRLQAGYRTAAEGATLDQRMEAVAKIFRDRQIPFEVQHRPGQLPVLTALACPYPELADEDRTICAMERMLISDLLEHPVTLERCRLNGSKVCTFEPSDPAVTAMETGLTG